MNDNRDALDYGEMRVPRLFVKLLIPTLLGMLANVLLNLADGIFVGRGVGSDALAAINVAAPVFLIGSGIVLMMASGVSIVAAVHLAKGNVKAANINVTQALTMSMLLLSIILIVLNASPRLTCHLFGGSDKLLPYVTDYLRWVSPGILMFAPLIVGLFIIRLDGSPKFAMMANVSCALLNIVLDYVMVFPMHMGIKGAAMATSLSTAVGASMVMWYFVRGSHTLHLYRPKLSRTAVQLTLRNTGYMIRLGLPTFIAETAIMCMMIVGNFMFMQRLHEDGVAAFSVACYLFPLVFMFGNAITQSSLPIVSYAHGQNNQQRESQAFRLSMMVAAVTGIVMTVLGVLLVRQLVDLFLAPGNAHDIAMTGMPYFSIVCMFFTINIVYIGYYQSIERYKESTMFMLLRGYLLVIPCFILLPQVLGNHGLWLAAPLSEAITMTIIGCYVAWHRHKSKKATT